MEKTRRFSSPAAAIEALRLQWEAFQSRGAILEGVRPEIAASWRRSAQLKLRCELPAVPLDEAALRGFDHAGQARHQFLGAGCKLADHLADELQDTNSAVIVCDDFGVLLYRIGSPDILRRSRSVNLVPGGVWGEKEAGTNGVGLALELGAPAHVYAAEHYMGAFHGFSCTGAPVHHPVTREVLGVLGLATDTSIAGSFAPALIARAARDVERLLEEQVFGRERELLEHYLRGRAGRQAPFLTVDRSGHTIIQNARMLQTATAEDVQLLLSIARHALHSETDAAEQLELSGGRSQAQVRLVHAGSELLGALVSVERAARPRPERACPAREDWAPLVGRSPAMERLFKEASKVAEQRMTVAVYGEPGTGKLTLAELLHRRKGDQEPLTVVHCSRRAWAEEWRDALRAGGTIVLNRVHALSAEAQLELADELDALATRSEPPWVISLVNSEAKPPGAELLFRLSRVSLTIPPLRDRGHDLRLLVEDWCEAHEHAVGSRPVVRPEVQEALAAQGWPGNVRELHNVLDAAALRGGSIIGVESLQLDTCAAGPGRSPTGSLREIERAAISGALVRNGGNVTRAARELGIGRATLHRRLRAYRLLSPNADRVVTGSSDIDSSRSLCDST